MVTCRKRRIYHPARVIFNEPGYSDVQMLRIPRMWIVEYKYETYAEVIRMRRRADRSYLDRQQVDYYGVRR